MRQKVILAEFSKQMIKRKEVYDLTAAGNKQNVW
jgi:hypothetical protein